ncbi:MAG: hypothetical protein ACP5XB_03840 [Isosphaeraceae bacterium]
MATVETDAMEDFDPTLSRFQNFLRHTGRCNALLQSEMEKIYKHHPRVLRLTYGKGRSLKTMTARRSEDRRLLARISSRLDVAEELREIDPAFAQALSHVGLTIRNGRLTIPDEEDFSFVSRAINALKATLGLPHDGSQSGQSGTGTTCWDILENLTGRIEAPTDWSAEHDHYLYGLPRRDEGGGE